MSLTLNGRSPVSKWNTMTPTAQRSFASPRLVSVKDSGDQYLKTTNQVSKTNQCIRLHNATKVALKEREIEFMIHACSEKNYREIAEQMYLSPKTVEGYRDKLYEKLNIRNRIGLVLYAIKNGFFKP